MQSLQHFVNFSVFLSLLELPSSFGDGDLVIAITGQLLLSQFFPQKTS